MVHPKHKENICFDRRYAIEYDPNGEHQQWLLYMHPNYTTLNYAAMRQTNNRLIIASFEIYSCHVGITYTKPSRFLKLKNETSEMRYNFCCKRLITSGELQLMT